MTSILTPPRRDPLRALFSGKRRSDRVAMHRAVRLEGAERPLPALLLDISPGGALIRLQRSEASESDGEDALAWLEATFPAGFRIDFQVEGITRRAKIVRATPGPDGTLDLGCRFLRAIEPAEGVVLGVAAARRDKVAPLAPLDRMAGAGMRMQVALHLEEKEPTIVGPCCIGRVLACGTDNLVVRLDQPEAGALAVARRLLAAPLRGHLVHRGRRLWEGRAALLVAERWDDPAGVALHLAVAPDLGRAVLRPLRRIRADDRQSSSGPSTTSSPSPSDTPGSPSNGENR